MKPLGFRRLIDYIDAPTKTNANQHTAMKRPNNAVPMAGKFTPGVVLSITILGQFLMATMKRAGAEQHCLVDRLQIAMLNWLIQCKNTNTVPEAYVGFVGGCIGVFRSDTGQEVARMWHDGEPIAKAVHFCAAMGITLQNVWHGEREWPAGRGTTRVDEGWWYDHPSDPFFPHPGVPFRQINFNA